MMNEGSQNLRKVKGNINARLDKKGLRTRTITQMDLMVSVLNQSVSFQVSCEHMHKLGCWMGERGKEHKEGMEQRMSEN